MEEKEVIITFETLYELLRLEKNRPEIQGLNDSFYFDVIKYLKEKTAILKSQENKKSIFADVEVKKTRKQLENITKILKDLYEKRESKIINLALIASRTNPENNQIKLLKEEKEFYHELIGVFSRYRGSIQNRLIEGKLPILEKPKGLKKENNPKNQLVRFLYPLPKFTSTDLKVYGPFDKEDVANLQEEVVEVLVKKGKVERI